jgi:hypothetical protein
MLTPLDIQQFKKKHGNEIGYLSHSDFAKQKSYPIIQQKLYEDFKKMSRVKRKTRLKIEGDMGQALLNIATCSEMQNHVSNNISELPNRFENDVEGGMLITEDGVIHVIRHFEQWYMIREDIKPIQLLEAFMEPVLAKKLVRYTKRSIVRLKIANTIDDTKRYNSPTHLVRTKKATPNLKCYD